ncbi:AUX/IAA protein [Dioscorea alata]|uniref:AUX/IAA protein n=1 Tax=Dioscorea alata TaxID=55571 RepID=A0ACB7WE90_DIOAL|nr:AUX/IAA protein [Dioscorea alata]
MDASQGNKGLKSSPQLLNLIPNGHHWMVRDTREEGGTKFGAPEEKKLELSLCPPGTQQEHQLQIKDNTERTLTFLQQKQKGAIEGKAECPLTSNAAGTNNGSQTRTTSVPVVGWPPIRTFRKNIASSSSKPSLASPNVVPKTEETLENCKKGLFLKINMDGIPIGRKIDLKAYNSYEKLSLAVEELFLGLLAAQRDHQTIGIQDGSQEKQAFKGLLDGTGEYTLVYEDNEGDRMLAGDIPWDMFVSTAKRLRVLKTADISALASKSKGKKRTSES